MATNTLVFTTTFQTVKNNGVKLIVYGRSGVGKTVLLATAPKPIIASAEAGLLSLSPANLKRIHGRAPEIPVVEIDTLATLIEFYDWCADPDNGKLFDTVCLDSATEIAEKVLANAKEQTKDPRQAYGELIEKMTNVFKLFRDLPGKNVVFVAKQGKLSDAAASLQGIAMPGSKLAEQVPYLFDEVLHLDIGKTEDGVSYRFLQTALDVQYDAKDRSGALDPIEEPNLTNIINKIKKV
jgi:hypothetical protein